MIKHFDKSNYQKKAISDAENILAELLQGDEVPSVIEPEPTKGVEKELESAGIEFTDTTPPRTDLSCYLCDSKARPLTEKK